VKKDEGGFYLESATGQKMWTVVSSDTDKKIDKFDVIKIGRGEFKVKDYKCAHEICTEQEVYEREIAEAFEVKDVSSLKA